MDVNKVTKDKHIYNQLSQDPIGFMKYPIYFLTSLFCADLKQVSDGSIKCPVVVLVEKGDPLFPFEYTEKVFELIEAPYKEMLIFDEDKHLIMNECVDEIIAKNVFFKPRYMKTYSSVADSKVVSVSFKCILKNPFSKSSTPYMLDFKELESAYEYNEVESVYIIDNKKGQELLWSR